MYLQGLANTVPSQSFTQKDCWDIFIKSETSKRLKQCSINIIQKVLLGDSGIDKRHFALAELEKLFELDAESLNRAFEREAPILAGKSFDKALTMANLKAKEIDALFVCTCTGYLCPGISSHVAEQKGLRSDLFLQDIVGLGCGAAIPTIRSASHFLSANPKSNVAVIAVEICSAAFYLEDDPGVLISACLFGDGASTSIWSTDEKQTGLFCYNFDTLHLPENRNKLRFENNQGKLRNRLHNSIPKLASNVVSKLFHRQNSKNNKVGQIISHTGGREVIKAIESKLPDYSLSESAKILRKYGNMSSPSVLFALEEYLKNNNGDRDLWLTTFGAGFSCHSCSIRQM